MTTRHINPPAVLCSLPTKSVDLWVNAMDSHTYGEWAYARRCTEALRKRAARGDSFAASAVVSLRQDRARARHLVRGGLPMVPR